MASSESREKLCVIMMIGLGLSLLFPWNTILKIIPYLRVKLGGTKYEGNFTNYLTTSFSASNVISMAILVLGRAEEHFIHSNQARIIIGQSFNVVLLGIAALGPLFDILELNFMSANSYFYLLILVAVLIGMNNSLLQKGVYGFTAKFPSNYTPMLLLGQGMAGFITTLVSFGLATGTSEMALLFFWIAMITIMIGLILFLLAQRNSPTFKQYTDGDEDKNRVPWKEMKERVMEIKFYAIAMLVVMGLTLSLYPAIVALVYPTDWTPGKERISRYDEFFLQICYLAFDIGDVVGKSLPNFKFFKFNSHHKITRYLAYARFIYFPLFFSCHIVVPTKSGGIIEGGPWGWLIKSDILFFLIHFSFAVTNGYGNSLLLMAAPEITTEKFINDGKNEDDAEIEKRKGIAGNIMGLFINLGLAVGSTLSFGTRAILCRCNPFTT
jgi:solute carrier family 29 (equilibrative nucleoside transporter), member 1/2/3